MFSLEPGSELALLLRILVAAALSAVLGWERESAHKSAGLRTHIVVGIAAALYTVLASLSVQNYPAQSGLDADPIRVIQAIAIGIGFLGSGVIFVSQGRNRVLGLTTAASIWATAAVGVAAGLGHYLLSTATTVLLLLVLRALPRPGDED